jgi:hypothetical protein
MDVPFGEQLKSAMKNESFRILLIGDKNIGKTSLAFKIAYDCAAKGGSPLVICNKNKVESKLPLFVKLSNQQVYYSWSSEVLSHVHMKYVSSVTELKALIAGLHCFEPRPSTIIIEDFSLFIDPLYSTARHDPRFVDSCITLCAYITDVMDHFEQSGCMNSKKETQELQLVITDDCQDPLYLNVMRRCVSAVFALQKVGFNAVQLQFRDPFPSAVSSHFNPPVGTPSVSAMQSGNVVIYKNIQCADGMITLA